MKKPPIINKRLQILLLVVVLIAVVMFGFPADNGSKTAMKAKPTVKKAAKTDKSADEFTAADRTTTFEPTVMTVANVFKPLVYRKDAPGSVTGAGSAAANAVPADFADGDSNWRYTGTLEVDNSLSALIENRSTKDGIYLTRGQHWHNCVVQGITSSTVTLAGPSGTKTLELVTEDAPAKAAVPAAAAPAPTDPTQQQQQGGGRGRGNRGNGQFGNFGGGNGGFGGGNPFSGQIGGNFAPGSITVTPDRAVIASPGGVR